MFYKSSFDGDISQWDVSNVEQMGAMFKRTIFNENKKAFYDVRNYKSYKIQ